MHSAEHQTWRLLHTLLYLLIILTPLVAGAYLTSHSAAWFITTPPTPTFGAGVKVQTYAEILPAPNGGRTANAWADGATMTANSSATDHTTQAHAQAAWPEPATRLPSPTPTIPPATPTTADITPHFTVTQPVINVRTGPSTDHPVLQQAAAGRTFPLLGRWGDWWQIDAGATPGWVYAPLGEVDGDRSTIPTITHFPPAPTALPPATALPTATPDLSSAYPFAVERVTRHPEANTVTFYAYVHENDQALNGYYLWVTHHGAAYRSGPSSPLIMGTTKPAEPASPFNVAYNVKIDFPPFLYPTLDMTGPWTILLVDGNNQALSAPTLITITPTDPQRELYLRYHKDP